jgi:hypothetical protein
MTRGGGAPAGAGGLTAQLREPAAGDAGRALERGWRARHERMRIRSDGVSMPESSTRTDHQPDSVVWTICGAIVFGFGRTVMSKT